jgi:hypothetical protein
MTGQSSSATVTATLCSQCVFKVAVSIQNPAKCEVQFLHAKGETASEIQRPLVSAYGDGVMNRQKSPNGVVNFKREEVMFMIK